MNLSWVGLVEFRLDFFLWNDFGFLGLAFLLLLRLLPLPVELENDFRVVVVLLKRSGSG